MGDSMGDPIQFERAPAFQVHRFKKNLSVDMNESMADELLGVLEEAHEIEKLSTCLYSFMRRLDERLHDGYVSRQRPA